MVGIVSLSLASLSSMQRSVNTRCSGQGGGSVVVGLENNIPENATPYLLIPHLVNQLLVLVTELENLYKKKAML